MKTAFLDFEQPIAELEAKIEELRFAQDDSATDISEEIQRLQKKSAALTKEIYGKLTPWQVAQVARHPQRPYTLDYTAALFSDFEELHGDRSFADDPSIVGGLARFNGQSVIVIGHQKGRDTKAKIFRNFGMPRPEGYRKAMRLMRLAERFGIPVLSFVDTPGAYPGIGAEERGQAEAIGRNLYVMAELRVPFVCTIIGEGGSGGALAIAVGDSGLDRQDRQRTSGRRAPRSGRHGSKPEESTRRRAARSCRQATPGTRRGAFRAPDGLWEVQGTRAQVNCPKGRRRCLRRGFFRGRISRWASRAASIR
jgi:acetyl-CoA carboxylase carboxyl transferase alpha subunit